MKTFIRIVLLVVVVAVIAAGVYFLLQRAEPLEARPPGTDGAARWAYDLALPRAKTELDTDAVVVEIEGRDLTPDGRLAANRGEWKLDFSSFTAAERVSIIVDYEGNVTVGDLASPGVIHAIGTPPGTFPNTTAIFATTAGHGTPGTRSVENPVVCAFDEIAGNHVWTIKFKIDSIGETHKVRVDNVWLEVR